MPSFVCFSVVDAVSAYKHIDFYHLNHNLTIDIETLNSIDFKQNDVLYILRYFAVSNSKQFWERLYEIKKEKQLTVIEDISLEAFSPINTDIVDFVICSSRKWLPIPDGGILASKNVIDCSNALGSSDYTLYYFAAQLMKGEYNKNKALNKQRFLNYSNKAIKDLFEDNEIRKMSDISLALINTMDFEQIKSKRIENYDALYNLLKNIKEITVPGIRRGDVTPLGMFILTEKRDELFKHLIQNGVYCNIHWRTYDVIAQNENSKFLSEHCITIPCDQRYNKEHIQYITKVVQEFFE